MKHLHTIWKRNFTVIVTKTVKLKTRSRYVFSQNLIFSKLRTFTEVFCPFCLRQILRGVSQLQHHDILYKFNCDTFLPTIINIFKVAISRVTFSKKMNVTRQGGLFIFSSNFKLVLLSSHILERCNNFGQHNRSIMLPHICVMFIFSLSILILCIFIQNLFF